MPDPQHHQYDFLLQTTEGVSLENPAVIEAVKLFENRNQVLDHLDEVDQLVWRLENKTALPPEVKEFINDKLNALVAKINETIVEIQPAGEDVVRRIAATREIEKPAAHATTKFLPKDQLARLHEAQQDLQADAAMHPVQHLFSRARAVRAHERDVAHTIAETEKSVASFLTTARAQWSEKLFAAYNQELDEIKELGTIADELAGFLQTQANVMAMPTVKRAMLVLKDYTVSPTPALLQKLQDAVATLHALVETKPEQLLHRLEEWQLRIEQEAADALSDLAARSIVSPESIPPSVKELMDEVQVAGRDAEAWLKGVAEKINANTIAPEAHLHILRMLENQTAMKQDPHLAAFYTAVQKFREARAPKPEPKKSEAPPAQQPRALEAPQISPARTREEILAREKEGTIQEYLKRSVEQAAAIYEQSGLPTWAKQVSVLEFRIHNLTPDQLSWMETRRQAGEIIFPMPDAATQLQTMRDALTRLRPEAIGQRGERVIAAPPYLSTYFEEKLRNLDVSLTAEIPNKPYFVVLEPSKVSTIGSTNKKLDDQITWLATEQKSRAHAGVSINSMMPAEYPAFQTIWTIKGGKPFDQDTSTRFITIPKSPDGDVLGADWDPDNRRFGFGGDFADANSDAGVRVLGRVVPQN